MKLVIHILIYTNFTRCFIYSRYIFDEEEPVWWKSKDTIVESDDKLVYALDWVYWVTTG